MISGSSAHIHIHGTNISHNNGSEGGGLYVFTVRLRAAAVGLVSYYGAASDVSCQQLPQTCKTCKR
jgi:hypothetical protein